MAWLGFVTLLTIYWCFFVAATTGRIGWCLLTGWLLPILALTISFRKGMQVNGLMVLICFVLFLVCRSGLAELRGWNVKQRKKRPVLFWLLYTVIFLLMFYSVAQAQMQGYILNIQGWDSETMQVLRMVLELWETMTTVRAFSEISSCILAKLFFLKCASPTLSTSSTKMMSVFKMAVMTKPSLDCIPLE